MSDLNLKLTGRVLLEFLMSRFNMTEEQALANMREHNQDMSFLDNAAKRRMRAWKAIPEPRMPWEQFKRTWKDS